MYTYFLILNDYGIRPGTVWSLSEVRQPRPRDDDVYNAGMTKKVPFMDAAGKVIGEEWYGNRNWGVKDDSDSDALDRTWHKLAWDKTRNNKIDIRLFYAGARKEDDWTECRWDPANDAYPGFFRNSHLSDGGPICYSSEALKYA